MKELVALLVPISICVVLPIMIVWLQTMLSRHQTDQRTAILIESIRQGKEVDESLLPGHKKDRTPSGIKSRMLAMLLIGSLLLLVGIALIITYFAASRHKELLTAGLLLCGLGIPFIVYYLVGTNIFKAEIAAEETLRVKQIEAKWENKGIADRVSNDAKNKGIADQVGNDAVNTWFAGGDE